MRTIKLLLFAFIISSIISCSKSSTTSTPNPNVTFAATLSGTNETPPNASAGSGSATLTYNTSTKIFSVTVTYSGTTAAAGHIHKGAIGVAGAVIFPFSSLTSPITYTSAALDATQEADLMANLYYVNLHSTAFPGGEIRGQLIKQ